MSHARRSQLEHDRIGKAALERGVPQEHTKAGDRAGKLEVAGGPAVIKAAVDDVPLDAAGLVRLWLACTAA